MMELILMVAELGAKTLVIRPFAMKWLLLRLVALFGIGVQAFPVCRSERFGGQEFGVNGFHLALIPQMHLQSIITP